MDWIIYVWNEFAVNSNAFFKRPFDKLNGLSALAKNKITDASGYDCGDLLVVDFDCCHAAF